MTISDRGEKTFETNEKKSLIIKDKNILLDIVKEINENKDFPISANNDKKQPVPYKIHKNKFFSENNKVLKSDYIDEIFKEKFNID